MFRFLVVKYVSLGLTSARALLLAALMGPASYGVLGALVLVQQNLSYAALGVRESLTVRLAQAHDDAAEVARICSSALLWAWSVGAAVLLGAIVLVAGLRIGNRNWIWVGVIACLSITNEMFINISRDRNHLLKIGLLEVAFNAAPLAAAIVLMHEITATVVLQALAVGLLISVAAYAWSFRDFHWDSVNRASLGQLFTIGVPLAAVSFATTAITAVFVFSATAMRLGEQVGLLVFAGNLCMIVLFGLNMVAWAATSRSMRRVHLTSSADEKGERNLRLSVFFTLGIILSAALLLALKYVFAFVLGAYAGSEIYAVHLCLVQGSGLLLFKELNFLAVRGRSFAVAAGYGVMLTAVVVMAAVIPQVGILGLLRLALLLVYVLSLCCLFYCRRLGFVDAEIRARYLFLSFPPLFGLALWVAGSVGAVTVAIVFLAIWLRLYKNDLAQLVSWASQRATAAPDNPTQSNG